MFGLERMGSGRFLVSFPVLIYPFGVSGSGYARALVFTDVPERDNEMDENNCGYREGRATIIRFYVLARLSTAQD
jgi:hypothetical protein